MPTIQLTLSPLLALASFDKIVYFTCLSRQLPASPYNYVAYDYIDKLLLITSNHSRKYDI